jgi:hypothetical protein
MNKLELLPTATTPGVTLDPVSGQFSFWGRSLPDNSHEFFKQIHDWLAEYVSKPAEGTELAFRLEYFNTSSTAHFLKVFKKLETASQNGSQVQVRWIYDPEDEDMREAGEDFQTLTSIRIVLDAEGN